MPLMTYISSSKAAIVALLLALAVACYLRSPTASSPPLIDSTYSLTLACHEKSSKNVRKCGRLMRDAFASDFEVERLRAVATRVMELGGGDGPPTIFDLCSGALSKGDRFIDVYQKILALKESGKRLSADDLGLLISIVERAQRAIVEAFDVTDDSTLYLTRPAFFSRIRANATMRTLNDDYAQEHVDTIAYEAFEYTSLLYLNDHNVDFRGGEFEFTSPPMALVQPRRGRFVAFSSGYETPHRVRQVVDGERFALTIAFSSSTSARCSINEAAYTAKEEKA